MFAPREHAFATERDLSPQGILRASSSTCVFAPREGRICDSPAFEPLARASVSVGPVSGPLALELDADLLNSTARLPPFFWIRQPTLPPSSPHQRRPPGRDTHCQRRSGEPRARCEHTRCSQRPSALIPSTSALRRETRRRWSCR